MLIKCSKIISPVTKKNLGSESPWLKLNKEYIVLAMMFSSKTGIEVCIQTEHYNEPSYFSLSGFEIISQSIPISWITITKEISNETIIEMLPKSWAYNSFFDELEDEDPNAIAIFNKEVETIYSQENKR